MDGAQKVQAGPKTWPKSELSRSHTSSFSVGAFFRFGCFFFFAAPPTASCVCAPSIPSFIMEETWSGLGLGPGLGPGLGLG